MKSTAKSFDPRQTMARPDFEIFHYQDARMEEVPLHHHDFYEVYCFLNGNVEYTVEGKSFVLLPEDILLISPQELHRPKVEPGEAYERLVLWLSADCFSRICGREEKLSGLFGTGKNRFRGEGTPVPELMRRLAAEASSGETGAQLAAEGLLLQLLAQLLRLRERPLPDPGREGSLTEQAMRYIGAHFREDIGLASVADALFVDKYHLAHLFKKEIGTGVHRTILLKRLQYARGLLAEGTPPGAAARRSGFKDYANFYRLFRGAYGTPPGRISAAGRKPPEGPS